MDDENKRNGPKKTRRYDSDKTVRFGSNETIRFDGRNNDDGATPAAGIGHLFKERFMVKDCLNSGGEAEVFFCEDVARKRDVVLKLYNVSCEPKSSILEKIKEQRHPNIVELFEYGNEQWHEKRSRFYEIMEYADGGSMLNRLKLKAERRFSEKELTDSVIPQVAKGLEYCHANDITHRDLKPGNIFCKNNADTGENIVIGDFGISSILDEGKTSGETSGSKTAEYAAPEAFNDRKIKESDYYSLAISLIHLLAGVSPLAGKTQEQITYAHLRGEVPLPDNISERFRRLLQGLMVIDRKHRWGAGEIWRWLDGEEVPVYQETPVHRETPVQNPPYSLGPGLEARNPKELAEIVEKNREAAKKHLARGSISDWVKNRWCLHDLAVDIEDKAEKCSEPDLGVVKLIYILDPTRPYNLFKGESAENLPTLSDIVEKKPSIAKEHVRHRWISSWISLTKVWSQALESGERERVVRLVKTIEGDRFKKNEDVAVFGLVYALNPSKPYVFEKGMKAKDLRELADLMDANWKEGKKELFGRRIPAWLICVGHRQIIEKLPIQDYREQQDRGIGGVFATVRPSRPKATCHPYEDRFRKLGPVPKVC